MGILNKCEQQSRTFAITIQVRNAKGESTGKTKTYETDSAGSLSAWYNKNYTPPKKKNKQGKLVVVGDKPQMQSYTTPDKGEAPSS